MNNPLVFADPSGLCVCCKVKSFTPDPLVFDQKKDHCKLDQVKATGRVDFYAPFKVTTEFTNGGGWACECCRYRQEVKGVIRYRQVPGGTWTTQREVKDFEEDCIIENGERVCYGDRDAVERPRDVYSNGPDRQTGCTYTGMDEPGLRNIRKEIEDAVRAGKKLQIEINLVFKLIVLDTCCMRPKKDLQEIIYPVKCIATIPK